MNNTEALVQVIEVLKDSVKAQSTEQVIIESIVPFMDAVKSHVEHLVHVYTADELAEMLKTSKVTIAALRDCGILNPIRLGNKDIYPEEQVREFLRDYSGADLSNASCMKAELYRKSAIKKPHAGTCGLKNKDA